MGLKRQLGFANCCDQSLEFDLSREQDRFDDRLRFGEHVGQDALTGLQLVELDLPTGRGLVGICFLRLNVTLLRRD
jgi:hypothetical protein